MPLDRRTLLTTGFAALALTPAAPAVAQLMTSAPIDIPTRTPQVPLVPANVLYAGSLVDVMEHRVASAVTSVGVRFLGEGKGSLALAREIESGQRPADVFISADTSVLDGLGPGAHAAYVSWYVTFAATRLVLGYSRESPFAPLFARAAAGKVSLETVLTQSNLRIGRTDPALDPKGYRTILAMQLLELDALVPPGFSTRVLGSPRNPSQILPEETLLSRLETGDVDLAFLYRTEAVSRRLPSIELPASANLGDPARAASYARTGIVIDGVSHHGSPATYAVTIVNGAPHPVAARAFVGWIFSDDGKRVLGGAGLDVLAPLVGGDRGAVPAALRPLVGLPA